MQDRCTTAKAGSVVTIRPHHDLQAAARHQAATDPAWHADYRHWRPMVESAMAWLVARGNRSLPTAVPTPTTAGSTTAPPHSTFVAQSTTGTHQHQSRWALVPITPKPDRPATGRRSRRLGDLSAP
ncbi:transposase [Nonomuraea sp. NPDC050451]|uniref:transposase n=1 Tax=Nonomuraea sp. NPDC050451 TaxID=3364364 RepID=UPI0037B2753B